MKVLLVSFRFPPAGGGGAQRPLQLAQDLPALGIEIHVLAPDGPRPAPGEEEPRVPTRAWVHRARYLGPGGQRPDLEPNGAQGLARLSREARLVGLRALVPDENVTWNLTAIPAAIRLVRRHGITVVITTSPPVSTHLVGAAVKRVTGARWAADLGHAPGAGARRLPGGASERARARAEAGVAKLVARSADAIMCVTDAIAEEVRSLEPRGRVVTTPRSGSLSGEETASVLRSLE